MRPAVMVVAQLVAGVSPGDDREAEDIRSTLAWMQRTDDVFRREKPATPDRHLVSYVVPVDPDTGHLLLGEHLNAALRLPPGGHVEVDEHPATTARREAAEELQVDAANRLADRPLFLSVTETVGRDSGHTDVSLWFLLLLRRDEPFSVDHNEFRAACWWSPDDIRTADPATLDPSLNRFLVKLRHLSHP